MHFVDTTPSRYDDGLDSEQRVAVERHRVHDPWQRAQTLVSLKNLEAPIRIGLPELGTFFSSTLWSVDTVADRMVFRVAREPGVLEIVTNPGRLWGAAYDANCKVQFDLRQRTFTTQGDFWSIGAAMPRAMYLLARRTDVRTRHSAGAEPRVRVTIPGGGQQALDLPIHDISAHGFSFLLSPEEVRMAVGMEISGAEIELAPGEFLFADFRICSVRLHDKDGEHLRFGCAWILLSDEAERLIERWTQRSRQRRQMLSLDL